MASRLGENIAREWSEEDHARELWDALQLRKSDPIAGTEELRLLAEGGSRLAMVYLGAAYRDGKDGLALNLERGEHWLRRSADAGSIEGAYGLAHHFLKTGRVHAALEVYERVGDRGYSPAFYALGAHLYKGDFGEADTSRALKYFLKAEAMDHFGGAIWVSRILLRGELGLRGRIRGFARLVALFPRLVKTLYTYPESDRLRT
jgi:TPR repeat protein